MSKMLKYFWSMTLQKPNGNGYTVATKTGLYVPRESDTMDEESDTMDDLYHEVKAHMEEENPHLKGSNVIHFFAAPNALQAFDGPEHFRTPTQ